MDLIHFICLLKAHVRLFKTTNLPFGCDVLNINAGLFFQICNIEPWIFIFLVKS